MIAAHLARLSERLPADLVDELADGLPATHYHRTLTADPDNGATAALAESGDADTLVRALETQTPGRRTATLLLVSGPAMGACCGPR